jgi:hypothetical protein
LARRAEETLAPDHAAHGKLQHIHDQWRNRLLYHWGMSVTAIEELERPASRAGFRCVRAGRRLCDGAQCFRESACHAETELRHAGRSGPRSIVADVNEADAANSRALQP